MMLITEFGQFRILVPLSEVAHKIILIFSKIGQLFHSAFKFEDITFDLEVRLDLLCLNSNKVIRRK